MPSCRIGYSSDIMGRTADGEMLSLAVTAERLGVSVSTVKKMAVDGRLPAAKVGGQWRVHREQLEARYGLVGRAGGTVVPSVTPERIDVGTARAVGDSFDGGDEVVTVTIEAIDIVTFQLVLTHGQAIGLAAELRRAAAR